jgi:hypothetical protein
MRGAGAVTDQTADTIGAGASAAVKTVAEVGGDVGAAARATVEGAIQGALEMGSDTAQAASAAASGAIRAAGSLGRTALGEVQQAVTGVIMGVKVVLKEPFKAEPR